MSERYDFTNLARYTRYGEQAIRNAFERGLDFFAFNFELVRQHSGSERMIAFDPSHIRKSGKKTYGLGHYWSGAAAQALKGLKIACLACVDVAAETALHLEAFQTPAAPDRNGKSLVTLYAEWMMSRDQSLLALSRYMVVDGYFMKKEFILHLLGAGMHVITKMRPDANLHDTVRPQDQPKSAEGKKRKATKSTSKR